MRSRFPRALAISACIAITAPLPAQSEARAADSVAVVPAELAIGLLGFPGPARGTPTLVVGRLPAGFPADLAPSADARVLGGVSLGDSDDADPRASIAVIATPSAPAASLEALEARLLRSGWRRPEQERAREGFVPSRVERSSIYCRDSLVLSVWATTRQAGGSHLRLSLHEKSRHGGYSPCAPESGRVSMSPFDDVPMPTLRAPTGVESRGGASSGGSGSRSASTRLRTTLQPARILDHYASQLQGSGWTPGRPLADGPIAVQSAQMTDAEGRRWLGLLTVMAVPGSGVVQTSFHVSGADADDF